MEPVQIPRQVDSPPYVGYWRLDEMMPVIILLVIGFATGYMPVCLVLGIALTFVYRRFRDSKPDGYLTHMLWWYGVAPLKLRSIRNAFIRHILP